MTRKIRFHLALLVLASGFALRALTRTDTPLAQGAAEIWGGKPEQIERLEFENDKRHVIVEFHSDAHGRYAIGSVERGVAQSPADPHAAAGDAGAPPLAVAPRETVRFVAVKDLNELVEKLAPLRANRDLGPVPSERLSDYGLDGEKLPKLQVKIGGAQHELWFGSATPGGGDVYAFTADRTRAIAVPADLLHDLEAAETRLLERSLHGFEADTATRVVIHAGEATRELVRSSESATFWTDPATPAGKDETASNWMKNFDRLRVNEYVEPSAELKPLLRAEYFDTKGTLLGFAEFATREQPGKAKPDFLVRSEYTRWWGKVQASAAEPIAQDLASIVK
jgi:Domain of unknown function (DUF4340)